MNRRRVALVALYVATSLWWGPAAESAFRLERADGSRPEKGINLAGYVIGAKTYRTDVGTLQLPRPKPRVIAPRVIEPSGHRSANPMVRTQGCEASHAQQFNPSKKYWGWYQFDRRTWAAHGGNPNDYGRASTAEQDRVASRVKYDAWPNC